MFGCASVSRALFDITRGKRNVVPVRSHALSRTLEVDLPSAFNVERR
jgi:hypothetical protein